MRCKRHLADLTSSVGVCASCLRERLFALIAAQAQQAQARADEDRRLSDAHPPPLVFPRSVSPYITRRRADDSSWDQQQRNHSHSLHDQRFYSTPQVGPASTRRKKHSKFSLFSNLFASRSGEIESDLRVSRASLATPSSSTSSSSWFSSFIPGRRKNKSRLFSLDEAASGVPRPCRTRDRGMSPAKWADGAEDCEDYEGGSPSASGYSSDSSQPWRKTPTAPPVRRRGPSHHSRNISSMAFCLSPLVRASPNSHRNPKGVPPDLGFSGEIRAANKPHLSTAASFCANRSRKLADFGKYNFNP